MRERRRIHAALLALVLPVLAAGCDDDSPTGPSGNTLVRVSGDGQSAPLGSPLPAPLTVRVEDASGNPVGDAAVAWSITAFAGAGAELSSTSSTTGGDGQTSVTLTLGDAAGIYEVRASAGGSSVTFTATATVVALEIVSGNGQVGFVGAALAQPLVVRAVGQGGAAAAGIEVSFAISEAQGDGAGLSATTGTTDGSGRASTSLTLGSAQGRFVVTASTEDSSVPFTAHACGGDPDLSTLDLAPGEDVLLAGAAAVACIQLPNHAAGAEYEVIVSSLRANPSPPPAALTLAVAGAAAGSPQVALPFREAATAGTGLGADDRLDFGWRRAQYAFDDRLRQAELEILPSLRPPAMPFGLMAVPSVGDTLDFTFPCTEDFPNAPEAVTGVVRAVSTRAVVVEDTAAQRSSDPFTQADFDAAAQTFDDLIYPTVTGYFGSPGDIDNNGGRVVLLYSAGVNSLTANYNEEGYIAGFFCDLDLGGAGNNAEMFYLAVPDPDGAFAEGSLPKSEVQESTQNTAAHEFQHLINAWRRIGAGRFPMDIALNEGLSHLAEEVVGHELAGLAPGSELGPAELLVDQDLFFTWYVSNFVNLATYLVAPDKEVGLVVTEDPLDARTFRMRGAAWFFVRYLLDRFDTAASEAQRVQDLVVTPATTMSAAISGEFGVSFEQLATEWNAMFAVEDRPVGADPGDLAAAPRAELGVSSYQLRTFYNDFRVAAIVDFVNSFLGLPQTSGYPLERPGSTDPDVRRLPNQVGLAGSIRLAAELFPSTGLFVRLTGESATAGTGLRLQETGSGSDVAAANQPRVLIVRTR